MTSTTHRRDGPSGGALRPSSASAGHSDLSRQEFAVNSTGIRGMDATPAELRAAGCALTDAVARRLHPPLSHAHMDHEKGALLEALLALGVGEEPTVMGAVYREAYLTGPTPPTLLHDPSLPPAA